jgi:hypothetical protein
MLGVLSPREPLTGKFADELRGILFRKQSGNLNDEDKNRIAFQRRARKIQIVKGF